MVAPQYYLKQSGSHLSSLLYKIWATEEYILNSLNIGSFVNEIMIYNLDCFTIDELCVICDQTLT